MRGRSLSVLGWAASYLTGVLVRVSRWRHPSNQRRRCGTFWNYLPRRASSATLHRLGFALLLAADSHDSGSQYFAPPSISSTGGKYLYHIARSQRVVQVLYLYGRNSWGRLLLSGADMLLRPSDYLGTRLQSACNSTVGESHWL